MKKFIIILSIAFMSLIFASLENDIGFGSTQLYADTIDYNSNGPCYKTYADSLWGDLQAFLYTADDGSEFLVFYHHRVVYGLDYYQIVNLSQISGSPSNQKTLIFRKAMMDLFERTGNSIGVYPTVVYYQMRPCWMAASYNVGDKLKVPANVVNPDLSMPELNQKFTLYEYYNLVKSWMHCSGEQCCQQKYHVDWETVDAYTKKINDWTYQDNTNYNNDCPNPSYCNAECDIMKFNWNDTDGFSYNYDPKAKPKSIKYINNLENINISPNPGNGRFTLKLNHELVGNCKLNVYDNSGNQVFESNFIKPTKIYSGELNLKDLISGRYTIKIKLNEVTLIKSIVIIK